MLLSYLVLVLLILQVPGVFFKCVDLWYFCGYPGTSIFSASISNSTYIIPHRDSITPILVLLANISLSICNFQNAIIIPGILD